MYFSLVLSVVFVFSILYQNQSIKINNNIERENLFTKYYIFDDHHEILNVIDSLTKSNQLSKAPKILINVDYHSDTCFFEECMGQGPEIGNWISFLISSVKVNEVYWIYPDECYVHECLGERFKNKSSDRVFWVDVENKKIYYKMKSSTGNLSQVIFHRRPLSQFPTISSDQEVILSVDADFFDPLDPTDLSIKNTEEALVSKLSNFSEVLRKSEIKPKLIGWSRSKEFTSENFNDHLEDYFNNLHLIFD